MMIRLLPILFLLVSFNVFAQTNRDVAPVPRLSEDQYYSHSYLSFKGSLDLSVLSPPDNFYFAFVAPGTLGRGMVLPMPISSTGFGPGFTFMPGLDLPISGPYKFLINAGVKYESVSRSETTQATGIGSQTSTYSLSIWSIAAEAKVRRALTDVFFAEAGFSATYYLLDYFSGSYQLEDAFFNIEQQKSKYSYNPQRYGLLLGGGFLVPLVDQHVLSVALNVNVPWSQLFYGVTSAGYDSSHVAQAKLLGIELSVSYNIPLGNTRRRDESTPTE